MQTIVNNTNQTLKYKIIFNDPNACPEETKWKILLPSEIANIGDYQTKYPNAELEFHRMLLRDFPSTLFVSDNFVGHASIAVEDDILGMETTPNTTQEFDNENDLLERISTTQEPAGDTKINNQGNGWRNKLKSLKQEVSKGTLTKGQLCRHWDEIKDVIPNPTRFQTFLKDIHSYNESSVLTRRQCARANVVLGKMVEVENECNVTCTSCGGSHHTSVCRVRNRLNLQSQQLVYSTTAGRYVPATEAETRLMTQIGKQETIKDNSIVSMVLNALDECKYALTSSIGIIIRDMLCAVEIHSMEEATKEATEGFMLIRDVLESQGYKFDGEEGFVSEPTYEKLKHAFEKVI